MNKIYLLRKRGDPAEPHSKGYISDENCPKVTGTEKQFNLLL